MARNDKALSANGLATFLSNLAQKEGNHPASSDMLKEIKRDVLEAQKARIKQQILDLYKTNLNLVEKVRIIRKSEREVRAEMERNNRLIQAVAEGQDMEEARREIWKR